MILLKNLMVNVFGSENETGQKNQGVRINITRDKGLRGWRIHIRRITYVNEPFNLSPILPSLTKTFNHKICKKILSAVLPFELKRPFSSVQTLGARLTGSDLDLSKYNFET